VGDGANGGDLQDVTSLAVDMSVGPILCGENLDMPFTRARVIHSPAKEGPYRNGGSDARQAPPHFATTLDVGKKDSATTFDLGKNGRIAAVADPLRGLSIPLLLPPVVPSYEASHEARHSSENCANEKDSISHSSSFLRRIS
jgi:hypothetical protein